MSSNTSTITDEDGAYSDWIELVNYGTTPIDLQGFGLTDLSSTPFKWVFPAKVMAPGEFLLVWASSKDRTDPSLPLHTNFAISAGGEDIVITAPDGTLVDQMPSFAMTANLSRGRLPDGTGAFQSFSIASPGTSNQGGVSNQTLANPVFSTAPGIYPTNLTLSITHPAVSGVTIRYTLDGSEPTATSPVYQQPLQIVDRSGEPNAHSMIPTNFISSGSRAWVAPSAVIRKGTIIRAKAFTSNNLVSEVITGTYIVLPGRQYTLPVISVVSPHDSLFSNAKGIYVPGVNYVSGDDASGNYEQRGDAWERPGSIEFFGPGLNFQQNIGLRINGDFSRRFPQKSLRIVANGKYGKGTLDYPVFPNYPYSSFKRWVLRNSGNDWGHTMFKDAVTHLLAKHILPVQAYRPTVVFLNGEYWGIHNIRERSDKHYLATHFGVDPDNIDYLSRDREIEEGDAVHYNEMLNYIRNTNLSVSSNFEGLKTRMDVDDFTNYFSVEIYTGNDDWPQSNIDYWRARVPFNPNAPKGQDGRWRWIFADTDEGFGDPAFNSIAWITAVQHPDGGEEWPNFILRNLLTNQQFKYDFINRIADHLNTAFIPSRVIQVIDSIAPLLQPEMPEHIQRWSKPSSVSNWSQEVQDLRNFATARPGYVRQHLVQEFNLASQAVINLNVSDKVHGSIKINTLVINSNTVGINVSQPYPWQGVYFQGVPVTLKALANQGYRFDHWTVGSQVLQDEEIVVNPTNNLAVTAFFVPSSSTAPTLLLPVNNATGVAVQPTLSWNSFSGALSYRLQVSLNAGFSTTVLDQANISATSATVPGLANNTVYYWRVLATLSTGVSDWSETRSFTTISQAPAQFSLNVTANGSGSVAKTPDQATYAANSTVQLAATPATGFQFSGWSGDASGSTNPLTVTMSSNKNITATFTAIPTTGVTGFELINASSDQPIQSLVSGAVLNLATLPTRKLNIRALTNPTTVGSVGFNLSGQQTKTRSDDSGPIYSLQGDKNGNYSNWTPPGGNYTLTARTYTGSNGSGTASAPTTITFSVIDQVNPPVTYTLNTTTSAGGSVSRNPNQATYNSGSTVTLTATPLAGYQFSGWSGDASGATNPLTVTMNSNKNITATFIQVTTQYSLSVIINGSGSVAKSPDQVTYLSGTSVQLTAMPSAGFQFSGWSGNASGSTNPLTVTMNSNMNITASFTATPTTGVTGFNLINASADNVIRPLVTGDIINLATLPTRKLNIQALTNPNIVGSVAFNLSGQQTKVRSDESGPTYSLFGDSNGDYSSWTPTVGSYTLTARTYTGANGSGTPSAVTSIGFSVIDQANTRLATTSSVPETVGNQHVKVSPNPFKDGLTIELPAGIEAEKATVTLSNLVGKTVYQKELKVDGGLQTIELYDLPDLSKGMYTLKLRLNESPVILKVVKQ
ncbi:InlB B-repeat-containing protein [Adhaeribacter terreus]